MLPTLLSFGLALSSPAVASGNSWSGDVFAGAGLGSIFSSTGYSDDLEQQRILGADIRYDLSDFTLGVGGGYAMEGLRGSHVYVGLVGGMLFDLAPVTLETLLEAGAHYPMPTCHLFDKKIDSGAVWLPYSGLRVGLTYQTSTYPSLILGAAAHLKLDLTRRTARTVCKDDELFGIGGEESTTPHEVGGIGFFMNLLFGLRF